MAYILLQLINYYCLYTIIHITMIMMRITIPCNYVYLYIHMFEYSFLVQASFSLISRIGEVLFAFWQLPASVPLESLHKVLQESQLRHEHTCIQFTYNSPCSFLQDVRQF